MTELDWGAIILAALGLGTAIVRVVSRRRSAAPAPPAPAPRVQPAPMPPAPPGRTDAAITAAEHEKARQDAARRAVTPAPVADLTKPAPSPSSDDHIEPRDLQ